LHDSLVEQCTATTAVKTMKQTQKAQCILQFHKISSASDRAERVLKRVWA